MDATQRRELEDIAYWWDNDHQDLQESRYSKGQDHGLIGKRRREEGARLKPTTQRMEELGQAQGDEGQCGGDLWCIKLQPQQIDAQGDESLHRTMDDDLPPHGFAEEGELGVPW